MAVKGHITREYTAWCAMCDRWDPSEVTVGTVAAFERQLRASGWHKAKAHGWVCPDHRAEEDV